MRQAGLTQLVECQLPKLNAAGSIPVACSIKRNLLFRDYAFVILGGNLRGFDCFAFRSDISSKNGKRDNQDTIRQKRDHFIHIHTLDTFGIDNIIMLFDNYGACL